MQIKTYKIIQVSFLIFSLLIPNFCIAKENQLKTPYEVNHKFWINDPKRQKPDFLAIEKVKDWKPPLKKIQTLVHLDRIYDLNHKNQTYSLQGSVSLLWNGVLKGWSGKEYEEIWLSFNSIKNYDFEKSEWYEPYIDRNDKRTVTITFDGYFNANFDYSKFPFDNQVLSFEYEPDNDAYEIIFEQKELPTTSNNFNKILDYNIDKITFDNKIKVYPTTFGIPDYEQEETAASSIVRTTFWLKKSFLNAFFIYVAPIFLISILLLLNSTRLSLDRGVKLSLPPASLVAIIFLQNDVNQTLPKLAYLTYLHYLYIYSYLLVFICFLEAMFSYNEELSISEKSYYFMRRTILITCMNVLIFVMPFITYFFII